MGVTSAPPRFAAHSSFPTSGDGGSPHNTAKGDCEFAAICKASVESSGHDEERSSLTTSVEGGVLLDGDAVLGHSPPEPLALDVLAESWPELAALRAAASSPNIHRLRCAVTSFVSHTRVEFAAALLDARRARFAGQPESYGVACPAALIGQARHQAAIDVRRLGRELSTAWHLSHDQVGYIFQQLDQLVSMGHGPDPCPPPALPPAVLEVSRFPHAVGCFLAALATGWPWLTALLAFQCLDKGYFLNDARTFLAHDASLAVSGSGAWTRATLSPAGSESALITVFLVEGKIVLVSSDTPLRSVPARLLQAPCTRTGGKRTRWLPSFIRLPRDSSTGLPIIPDANVTTVVERAGVWHARLGPLDGTAKAIVDGNFTYPRKSWALTPSWMRNHPSWEDDLKAKEALGPTIASWISAGVLEYVSADCIPPLIVEPVGAVAKNSAPWYRLIMDARKSNKELDDWPVRYLTVLEAAAGLRYGALMCADDAKDAYHLSAFAGCTGELSVDEGYRLQPDGSMAWASRRFLGCSPRTCLGTCDKARSGICLEGHLFRFAAAQFGQKLAGSPLNALFFPIMRHLVRRFSRFGQLMGLLCFLWVDDMLLAQNILEHGRCGGIGAGCVTCTAAAAAFRTAQSYWHALACELGITLSLSKRQNISQRAEYTGIVLDTIQGRFFIPEKKLQKLRDCLRDLERAESFSLRTLQSVRGRVMHYSICIMHIRPLAPLISAPGADQDTLDARLPMTVALRRACSVILNTVDTFADLGAPMWPPVPSSLYGRFLRKELTQERVAVIIWDSSVHGWGALVRWWANHDGLLVVGTFGPNDPVEAQVHREALGACLALAAASKEFDLHNSVVLFRNDAVGALSALQKGCLSSVTLQGLAARLALLCADLRAQPLFLHAPGKDLIAEGIDEASRGRALLVAGPACSDVLRHRVYALAARFGWTITIDAFASLCNRVVPRYFSAFAEPDAEAVDALSVTDWNCSVCPACGLVHRETLFAFPPTSLLRRFMAKAEADSIRAVIIVPFSITASFWRRLLEAALPVDDRGSPFVHLRSLSELLVSPERYKGTSLAMFAADFSRLRPRQANLFVPGCGQEGAQRGRPLHGSPQDQADRLRIHQAVGTPGL